jgi:hypothetical protein
MYWGTYYDRGEGITCHRLQPIAVRHTPGSTSSSSNTTTINSNSSIIGIGVYQNKTQAACIVARRNKAINLQMSHAPAS